MYTVPCEDLTNGDGKFNAWMREKLIIFVDEIKVYEDRSQLINMLKTWISERRIQTQAKGSGQIQTDNLANYLFFSNFKNAIPITRNSRRFMPIFSPLNSIAAIEAAGRGQESGYFDRFLSWFDNGGDTDTINWLMSRPVARGKIPMRAPHTNSSAEAWLLAQSPLERMVNEAVEEGVQGFKGGWVGTKSVRQRIRVTSAVTGRNITEQSIQTCLEGMGYVDCGIAHRSWPMEDTTKQDMRSRLFHKGVRTDATTYGRLQGWES
jgi:hypothetical protein